MTATPTRPAHPPADWPTFHLAHPSPSKPEPYDPNAIFHWAARYHFHYVYQSEDGFAYAHVSSPDLVHWSWQPTVLTQAAAGHKILSGSGFITKEGRPAIIYAARPGTSAELGPAQIVHALDDELDSWSAPQAIEPHVRSDANADDIAAWDPHGWLEGDTYYALYGRLSADGKATIQKSTDLVSWEYVGPLLSSDLPDAADDGDISCPEFFPLGREHMLLCISHTRGCRYYLGEWKDEQFTPTRHGRMNWQPTPHHNEWAAGKDALSQANGRAAFFAPETLLTPDGRRVMWAWCWIDGMQNGIQSLPRELSLPDDGVLRIAPLRELENLRTDEVTVTEVEVSPSGTSVVPGVVGDTLECTITIRYGSAQRFGVVVLCDADGAGGLPIVVDTFAQTLAVGDAEAPFTVAQDSVTLRVFIDKAMVEVFADDRQAVIGAHAHHPESVHVGLVADDNATADVTAWQLGSIYGDERASTAGEDDADDAALRPAESARS
jgi:sucrose-6-phosphate hydrolase SacC (GH32 family)